MPVPWTHREPVGYSALDCPVCFDVTEGEAFKCHRQLIPRRNPPKNPKHPPWHELVCRTCGFRERIDEPELDTSSTADLPMHMLIEDHRPEIVELAAAREAREAPVLAGTASPSEREAVLATRLLEMKPTLHAQRERKHTTTLVLIGFETFAVGISFGLLAIIGLIPGVGIRPGIAIFALGVVALLAAALIHGTAKLAEKADALELTARAHQPFAPTRDELDHVHKQAIELDKAAGLDDRDSKSLAALNIPRLAGVIKRLEASPSNEPRP